MTPLLLALLVSPADAALLDSGAWAVRQSAEARIASRGALGLPACWMAYWGSPEQRHRARRVLRPWAMRAAQAEGAPDRLLAWWLFHGPDEYDPASMPDVSRNGRCRWLRMRTGRMWARALGRERLCRLCAIAREWGLLHGIGGCECGMTGDSEWSWINVVRWRSVRVSEWG